MLVWKKFKKTLKKILILQTQIIILIWVCTFNVYSAEKINPVIATDIVRFTLFNYDNLIADAYENNNDYIDQLAFLLNKGTNYSIKNFKDILNDEELISEANPVYYMVLLNKKTKLLTGYYFVDD